MSSIDVLAVGSSRCVEHVLLDEILQGMNYELLDAKVSEKNNKTYRKIVSQCRTGEGILPSPVPL